MAGLRLGDVCGLVICGFGEGLAFSRIMTLELDTRLRPTTHSNTCLLAAVPARKEFRTRTVHPHTALGPG